MNQTTESGAAAPRIWRPVDLDFNADEIAQAGRICTSEVLAGIRDSGFNGIWLRGRLRQLMDSSVLPELNDPRRAEAVSAVRQVIAQTRAAGLGLFLFFNEPLALHSHDPFWRVHPDLAGAAHHEQLGASTVEMVPLCLSHPTGARYLEEAAASILRDLPGLAGIILITASEHHSHCWSHHSRVDFGDGLVFAATKPLACPRCVGREPAELVAQIARAWRMAADAQAPACRIIAWNWSWSMWYPDPQAEVIDALPAGVDILADWERGGSRPWRGRTLQIDEYSLGYTGPSVRFTGTLAAARRSGHRTLAKLQIGTTHEVGTVPNLPLMVQLHGKLAGLHRQGVQGFMGTWNFGCSLSLNTAAVRHFFDDPARNLDQPAFLAGLALAYLGVADAAPVMAAWQGFGEAFVHYPFHIRFLYFSPVNDAPAHPLSFRYRAEALGGSWMAHALGDRLEDCLEPFTLAEVADAFADLAAGWAEALVPYRLALSAPCATATPPQRRQAAAELSCAEMLGVQWCSVGNLFRFHAERARLVAAGGLVAPCDLPRSPALLQVFRAEISTAEQALRWVREDPRLGYHQEAQAAIYDEASIHAKLVQMRAELGSGG